MWEISGSMHCNLFPDPVHSLSISLGVGGCHKCMKDTGFDRCSSYTQGLFICSSGGHQPIEVLSFP